MVPWAISAVVAGVVWRWMLLPGTGVLAYFLAKLGMESEFLLNPTLALVPIVLVDAWRQIGYAAVFLLAGLRSIDPVLYEGGAGGWRGRARAREPSSCSS